MKIPIDECEVFPVYFVARDMGTISTPFHVEASEDTLERWLQVFATFEYVQNEIRELLAKKPEKQVTYPDGVSWRPDTLKKCANINHLKNPHHKSDKEGPFDPHSADSLKRHRGDLDFMKNDSLSCHVPDREEKP